MDDEIYAIIDDEDISKYITWSDGNNVIAKFPKDASNKRIEWYSRMREDELKIHYNKRQRALDRCIGTNMFPLQRLFFDEIQEACKIKGIDCIKWN